MEKDNHEYNKLTFAQRYPRLNALLGVLILLSLIAMVILLLKSGINQLKQFVVWITSIGKILDTVVIVALLTSAVSIVSVITSSVVAKIIDYKQKGREYLYQKREEPYRDFVATVYKVMESSRTGNYSQEQMFEDVRNFSEQLTLWGSNRVIKKWLQFRTVSNEDIEKKKILFVMEDIIYEIRKDMGYKKMKKGKLLSIFINDLHIL